MYRLVLGLGAAVVGQTYARVWASELTQRRREPGEDLQHADALLVFGGKCFDRGPSIEVRERLNHAVLLWRLGAAPVIVVSGGIDGTVDEVEIMRSYLVKEGVAPEAIGEARPGDNTRLTIRALEPGRSYIAVSSAYHAHRIAAEARRQGKSVLIDCVPDSIDIRNKRVRRVRRAAEVAGCLVYATPEVVAEPARRLVGRLRHSVPGAFTPAVDE